MNALRLLLNRIAPLLPLTGLMLFSASPIRAAGPPNPPPPASEQPTDDTPVPKDPPGAKDPSPGGPDGFGGDGGDDGGPSCGDPVNLANGTEDYIPAPDISVYNPHGPDIVYQRRFISARAGDGYNSPGLSPGWTDNYDVRISGPNPPGVWGPLTITWPNGAHEQLTPKMSGGQPTGVLAPPSGSRYLVSGVPTTTPGKWSSITFLFKDQSQWTLTPRADDPTTYLLTGTSNRMGHTLFIIRDASKSYRLDRIRNDVSADLLVFHYDGNGKFLYIEDATVPSAGRAVAYSFGTASGTGLGTICLLGASAIVPYSGIPQLRVAYGYVRRNSQPYLSTITVPDPTNSGALTSTATINYNTAGKVTSLVDANGNQRVYSYNTWDSQTSSYGTKVEIKNTAGNVIQWWIQRFDPANNNVDIGVTDALGNVSTSLYTDALNKKRPTFVKSASGNQIGYTYDSFGNITSVTNPCGTTTVYHYEYNVFPLGRLMWIQKGSKAPTSFTYYPNGLVNTVTRPAPAGSGASTVTTTYTYNTFGDLLTVDGPGNNSATTIHTAYNYGSTPKKGQPLSVTVGTGGATETTSYGYDARGNQTSVTDGAGNTTNITYNLADQLVDIIAPATGDTGSGRSYARAVYLYPGGPMIRRDLYNEANSLVRQVNYAVGKEGELLSITGSTEPAAYTYDAAYSLKTLTDGNGSGHTTFYEYDQSGNLTQVRYPGYAYSPRKDVVDYTHDADGRVQTRTDGRGIVTVYTHTPCGLPETITYSDGTPMVTYHYDAYNRRDWMTDGTGRTDYTYDGQDNLVTATTAFKSGGATLFTKTLVYAYWPDGSRKSTMAPSGTFSYTYDAVGRMNGLTNAFNEPTHWFYKANGQLKSRYAYYANTDYTYNVRGFLTAMDTHPSGSPLSPTISFTGMHYDAAGNRTSVAVGGDDPYTSWPGGQTWQYDNKDRLTAETSTRSGLPGYTHAYDDAFNPTTLRSVPGLTYNSDNQRTGTGHVYDGNGNPVVYRGVSLAYDGEDRLTSFAGPRTIRYDYNGDGLRTARWRTLSDGTPLSVTYYLYDGTDPVCELDASGGVSATNTFGPFGLVSRRTGGASGSIFYAFDPQGNVAQRLDYEGNVLSSDLYDAYGNLKAGGSATDPFGYGAESGYYTDRETGLLLLTHRYYDPQTASFLTRDPIGYAGGINLYGYVGGNPVNWVDPEGQNRGRLVIAIAKAAGKAIGKAWNKFRPKPKPNPRAKPSPKFKPPTNPPSLPPEKLPPGVTCWRGRPTGQYPNGYWKLEKSDGKGFQRLDPRTMKPGSHEDTHIEFPPGYRGPFDN